MEVEGSISVNQDGMCWLGIFRKLSLVVACIKHRFNSLLKRGCGSVDSVRLVDGG